MLRYLVYRYFAQSGISIRGLEMTKKSNESDFGSAEILQHVAGVVGSVLDAKKVDDHGFGLAEAVHVVAIIEELIWDNESHLSDNVYQYLGFHTEGPVVRGHVPHAAALHGLQEEAGPAGAEA